MLVVRRKVWVTSKSWSLNPHSFFIVLFFFLRELNWMYSIIITWLITPNEDLHACSNMHSPVLPSRACFYLCLLALFSNYKLDISYGTFHHHFKLNTPSQAKHNIFLSLPSYHSPSFPSPQLLVQSLISTSSLSHRSKFSYFFCHFLRNLESQSSAFIHLNIILNAN